MRKFVTSTPGRGALAGAVDALADPDAYRAIRQRARRTVIEGYDLHTLALPAQLKLINEAVEPAAPYLWKRARN